MVATQRRILEPLTRPVLGQDLDISHPLAAGLKFLSFAGQGVYQNMIQGEVPNFPAGAVPVIISGPETYWDFSGTGPYLEYARSTVIAPPFSVFCRVIPNIIINESFIGYGGVVTGNGWKIGTGPSVATTLVLTFGNVADYSFTSFFPATGVKIDILVTVDKNGGTATAYKDGVKFGTNTVGTMLAPTKALWVGMSYNGTTTANEFSGQMGIAAVWNRKLSDGDAAWLKETSLYDLVLPIGPGREYSVIDISPELYGSPFGLSGQRQMHQLLAQ